MALGLSPQSSSFGLGLGGGGAVAPTSGGLGGLSQHSTSSLSSTMMSPRGAAHISRRSTPPSPTAGPTNISRYSPSSTPPQHSAVPASPKRARSDPPSSAAYPGLGGASTAPHSAWTGGGGVSDLLPSSSAGSWRELAQSPSSRSLRFSHGV